MSSIDERIVQMEFDNKQFEAGVGTTISSLDKLKESLKFKDGAFKNLQSSANALDLSPVSNGIFQVQQQFSLFGEFTRVLFDRIANRAIDLGRNLVSALTIAPIKDGFAEYETQMNSVQTIMANTKKEFAGVTEDAQLDAINGALDELNHYADKTIYNFTEMTRNIGTFTAAGVGLDDSVSAIQGIANLAAVSGANAHQASNAMYQLSQALSSGVVRLMDWNSVQNASMGGQFFQDALQKTADEFIETGREVENAAGQMVTYSEAAGITANSIEDIITKEGSFRNSLQTGWLTSDVLLETLSKLTDVGLAHYFSEVTGVEEDWVKTQFDAIDAMEDQDAAIENLAKTLAETGNISEETAKGYIEQMFLAQDAATKVKTFTQLIDTLKEALGSGWTKTIQLIFGDFKEAMELWTAVSDELSGIINSISEARNAMFQIWHDAGAGGGGRTDALQAIADVYFGIKSAILAVKEAFDLVFGSPTIEESAAKLMELTRGFSLMAGRLREFLESGDFTSRLQGIFGAFFSIAKAVLDVVGNLLAKLAPVVDVMSQFGWYVFSAADSLARLVTYFVEADDKLSFFNNLFESGTGEARLFRRMLFELGSALDILVSSVMGLFGVDVEGTPISDFLNKLTDFLRERVDLSVLDDLLAKIPSVSSVFEGLKSVIAGLVDIASTAFGVLSDLVKAPFAKLSEIFGGNEISSLADFSALDAIGAVFDTLGAALTNFFGFISSVAPRIGEAFRGMFSYLASEEFGRLAQNFTTLMGGGFLVSLKGLVDAFKENKFGKKEGGGLIETIKGAVEAFKTSLGLDDMVEQLTGALDSVSDSLVNLQNGVNATAILEIGVAVALLAHSIIALSEVDPTSMANGIAGISALFGELVGAFAIMSSMNVANPVGMSKAASAMVKMSVAVVLISYAVKSLSNLSMEQMAVGLLGVVGLLGAMARVAQLMSGVDGGITKSAIGVLAMSIAIRILASSVTYLSTLDWESLAKGLVGVGGLLLGIGLFSKLVDQTSMSFSSVLAIVAVSIAVKLLAGTVQEFSGMKWDTLIRGLTGVAVLIGALGVFVSVAGGSKMSLGAVASIIVIAFAIKMLSDVVQIFAGMNTSSLEQGVLSVGVLVLALSAIMAVLGKVRTSLANVVAIFVVAQALSVLSGVVTALGGLDADSLDSGLLGLAGAVVALVVPLAILGQRAGSMLVGAAAMVVAAAAIRVLVPAMTLLGKTPTGEIVKGLLSLVAALAVIGVGSVLLAAIAPSIFLASAAILAFGVACASVGVAILLISAGVTALAATLTVSATAIVAGIGILATGLQSLIVALITGLFTGIAEAATAFLYGIADILPALGAAIHAIGDFLLANLPYILGVIGTLAISIIGLLNTLIPAFISTVGSFIIALVQALVTWVPAISEALLTAVITLINSVADGIRTHGPEIIGAIANIISSILDLVLLAIEEVVRMIPGVGDMLGDQIASARTSLSEALSPSDIQSMTSNMMSGAQQGIIDAANGANGSASQAGKDIQTSLSDGLGDGSEVSSGYMSEFASGFSLEGVDLTALSGTLNESLTMDLSGAADGSAQSYIDAFNIDASQLSVTSLPEEIVGSLGSHDSEFANAGTGSINAFTNSLGSSTARSTASSNAAAVASSGASGANSMHWKFVNTGEYLGEGVGDGISNSTSYVLNKATALVNSVNSKMRMTAEVASPSKLTMEIGRYMGMGLGIGIGQLVPYVEKQSAGLGNSAINGLRESIEHVGDILNADMDFEPTITPVLDLSEIQNGASALGGILGSYGLNAGFGAGNYAINTVSGVSGRRYTASSDTHYSVYVDGARVNDIPAIHNATYDFLMTLKRYGDM